MEDMENGNQVLPFGNVEDMTGGMEIGESGNAFGQENASEATGLELSGESAGIGDLQDNMDSRIGSETEGAASMGDGAVGSGTSSYGGTQESSVSGLSADNFDTGTMEHMDGTGAVSGMEPAADSSGRVSGLEAAESGQNLPVGDSTGFAAGESRNRHSGHFRKSRRQCGCDWCIAAGRHVRGVAWMLSGRAGWKAVYAL